MGSEQKYWRAIKRKQRQQLSEVEKKDYSQRICQQFLASQCYRQANSITAYLALAEEVNVDSIIQTAWDEGKTVYLPVVVEKNQALAFAPYSQNTAMQSDAMGILAPAVKPDDYLTASDLEVVITPLVAFDCQGYRMGMGGGYYDRSFAFKKNLAGRFQTKLIGVAFGIQQLDEPLIPAHWDIALDAVITENFFKTFKT